MAPGKRTVQKFSQKKIEWNLWISNLTTNVQCQINFKAEINWVDSVSYLGTTGELPSWLVKLELKWSAVKLVLPLPCRAVPTGESIDKARTQHNESHPFRLQSVCVGFMGLNHSRRPLLLTTFPIFIMLGDGGKTVGRQICVHGLTLMYK